MTFTPHSGSQKAIISSPLAPSFGSPDLSYRLTGSCNLCIPFHYRRILQLSSDGFRALRRDWDRQAQEGLQRRWCWKKSPSRGCRPRPCLGLTYTTVTCNKKASSKGRFWRTKVVLIHLSPSASPWIGDLGICCCLVATQNPQEHNRIFNKNVPDESHLTRCWEAALRLLVLPPILATKEILLVRYYQYNIHPQLLMQRLEVECSLF